MYPNEFDYYNAETVEGALNLLDEHADVNTQLYAGGHSLLPMMKLGLANPDVIIDIGNIDGLDGIFSSEDTVTIRAGTTYATIAESTVVSDAAPALAEATASVGDRQVRNMGTIGGNIAQADPASDLPGGVIAVDAEIIVEGSDGKRRIPADDFFKGMYATALNPDEIVTRIEIPRGENIVGSYAKKPSPSSGYALIGVAVQLEMNKDTVESARIGANGILDHGIRLKSVEEALENRQLDEDIFADAASRATDDIDLSDAMDDHYASPEYRAHLLCVYTEYALEAATV